MNLRQELDCKLADVEILETILMFKTFGKYVSGCEVIEEPDGVPFLRFDQGARASPAPFHRL